MLVALTALVTVARAAQQDQPIRERKPFKSGVELVSLTATVLAAVKAAGFVGATTVVPGWADPADDLYRLPRLRVVRRQEFDDDLMTVFALR